jgi:hypothetical protein
MTVFTGGDRLEGFLGAKAIKKAHLVVKVKVSFTFSTV